MTNALGKPTSNTLVSIYIASVYTLRLGETSEILTCDKYTRSKLVDYVGMAFTRLFRGATIDNLKGNTDIVGLWLDDNGQCVTDNVTRIYSYSGTLTSKDYDALREIAETVKRVLSQDSVLVTVNFDAYFV